MAEHTLDNVVITAPQSDSVLTVTTDPKAPRQPVPAHDGADLLKNIPGFAVIRKGGTDGDPVFRGMAGSRLSILLDGDTVLGGCGNRMDPPTAYVFPQAYDSVTVLKGPQSVQHGPGSSAGTVLFERHKPDFSVAEIQGDASLLAASADRNDQMAHLLAGNQRGYLDLSGTRSDANNYRDGNGDEVHSAYTRWSGNAAIGWTPHTDSRIELSGGRSDGEARYADRAMDGALFDRSNAALMLEQQNISDSLASVKARIYRQYVDHVMDNFSLRSASGMKMVSNPDRETTGASLTGRWTPGLATDVRTGIDYQKNQHRIRNANNMMDMMQTPDADQLHRNEDMRFETQGAFVELDHKYSDGSSLHTGLRINRDEAEDLRANRTTSGDKDINLLHSMFARYEWQISPDQRLYAGLGHSERAADYWERNKNPAAQSPMMTGSASTFDVRPERTTQLDTGLLFNRGPLTGSVSAFYALHQDYILIEQLLDVSAAASNARNIRAISYGTEAEATYQLSPHWNTQSSFAWVRGENDSDNTALGQIAPPQATFSLNYVETTWSAGALLRVVGDQNRVAPGTGNIVGQDIGRSPGFAVFSVNSGWQAGDNLRINAGIDNLFDRAYAEHISRSGADISGYETTTRVFEPGRTWWLQLQASL